MFDKNARVRLFRSEKEGEEARADIEKQMNDFCSKNKTSAGHGVVQIYPIKFDSADAIGMGEKWFAEIWYKKEDPETEDKEEETQPDRKPIKKEGKGNWGEAGLADEYEDDSGNTKLNLRFKSGAEIEYDKSDFIEKQSSKGDSFLSASIDGVPTTLWERKSLTPPAKYVIQQPKE